jgi:hypothetical protein
MISHQKIQLLVVALLILCAAPMLELLVLADSGYWLQINWALSSTTIASLLLLSFWVGLGPQAIFKRLLGGILGGMYASFWPGLAMTIRFSSNADGISLAWEEHFTTILTGLFIVALFGTAFMVLRRWFRLAPSPPQLDVGTGRTQFSVLSVLLVMSATAAIMALVRLSRESMDRMESNAVVLDILELSTFFANTVGAVFAALGSQAVKRNCSLSLATSFLLGIALSVGTGADQSAWWLIAGGVLLGTVPTAIVIVSLLVVRSAGYRLVPNSSKQVDPRRQQDDPIAETA